MPASFPLACFLAERSPSSDSRLARRVLDQHSRLPPRLFTTAHEYSNANEARDEMSPPESPGSEGTSMLMSGNASLPALRRSSVGSLRSHASRSSWSIDTPGPVSNGVPLLPLAPNTPVQLVDGSQPGHGQPPAVLECPFIDLHCYQRFNNFNKWIAHSLEHFKDALPPCNTLCVFCGFTFHSEASIESWHDKLVCTANHHVCEGRTLADAYPDFALHNYLWEQGCITRAERKALGELKTDTLRRGNTTELHGPGNAWLSPPNSPNSPQTRNPQGEQSMVIMTSNKRRDRDRERHARELKRLQAQADAAGDD